MDAFDEEALFEFFNTDISHPIKNEYAKTGIEKIEYICLLYNIDELAQLDIFKNELLKEKLIEHTSDNDNYPYTMELLKN